MTPHEEKINEGHNEKRKLERNIIMKTKLTKIIMTSLAFACALVCFVAVIAPGTSATAQAAADGRVCNGTLKGLYLWTFDAYTNFGGNFVPTAVLQGLQFNGDGTTLNTFGTVNIGGTIVFDVTGAVGSYTVAPDCTGTLSITGGPNFNIYVGPGAQKVWTIQSSPTPASTGVSVGTLTRLPAR